jgi:chorismate mutase/prephenate dehydrogenase
MTAVPDPTPSDWTPERARAELERLREMISEVDERLIRTIGERRNFVLQVGRMKEILGLPVMDPGREAQVVRGAVERAREFGLDEEMTRDIFWRIIAAARSAQGTR